MCVCLLGDQSNFRIEILFVFHIPVESLCKVMYFVYSQPLGECLNLSLCIVLPIVVHGINSKNYIMVLKPFLKTRIVSFMHILNFMTDI